MANLQPREWVNKHREQLKEKFNNKTVLICANKVVKVFDGPADPVKINKEAKKICKKPWCYSYLHKSEEEYLL